MRILQDQGYTTSIEVPFPPSVVFAHLNDVSKWWPEEFQGVSGGSRLTLVYRGPCPENEIERLAQACDMVIKDKFYGFITGS
jgi:hypothetical protein